MVVFPSYSLLEKVHISQKLNMSDLKHIGWSIYFFSLVQNTQVSINYPRHSQQKLLNIYSYKNHGGGKGVGL